MTDGFKYTVAVNLKTQQSKENIHVQLSITASNVSNFVKYKLQGFTYCKYIRKTQQIKYAMFTLEKESNGERSPNLEINPVSNTKGHFV